MLPNECYRMVTPKPFRFPDQGCEKRRHAPYGYKDFGGYKEWLRDEFDFRCLYCLTRERWERDPRMPFSVEHLAPKSANPLLKTTYSNLAYACTTCNSIRGVKDFPFDPKTESIGQHLKLKPSGEYEPLSAKGVWLRDELALNAPNLIEFRRRILYAYGRVIGKYPSASGIDFDLFRYPVDLRDLNKLIPPGGNDRKVGITESAFARRCRGALPEFY